MADLFEKVKNGLTLDNVLTLAMRTPGVKINRAKFLRAQLQKYCSEEIIDTAIQFNPAKAGISKAIINKVSLAVINYESAKVTSISVAASIPGGAAAVGAAAADITSYFAFIFRAVQELAYLYGFQQFELNEEDMDAETKNIVLVFAGVMFGVSGAAAALQKFADVLAKQIAKKLGQKALMKGAIYPIVKKVALAVGIRMTKQIFADSVASAVPVLGGALSGGLTFFMFRPGCMKLRSHLMTYNLSDPDYYKKTADETNTVKDADIVVEEDAVTDATDIYSDNSDLDSFETEDANACAAMDFDASGEDSYDENLENNDDNSKLC